MCDRRESWNDENYKQCYDEWQRLGLCKKMSLAQYMDEQFEYHKKVTDG